MMLAAAAEPSTTRLANAYVDDHERRAVEITGEALDGEPAEQVAQQPAQGLREHHQQSELKEKNSAHLTAREAEHPQAGEIAGMFRELNAGERKADGDANDTYGKGELQIVGHDRQVGLPQQCPSCDPRRGVLVIVQCARSTRSSFVIWCGSGRKP